MGILVHWHRVADLELVTGFGVNLHKEVGPLDMGVVVGGAGWNRVAGLILRGSCCGCWVG
jgi:hypothetical protein